MKARATEACPTFAMASISGIGDMPDTIEDRAVIIKMQRRPPTDPKVEFKRRDVPDLHKMRTSLAHATNLALGLIDSYETPSLPVTDRAADVWEPLASSLTQREAPGPTGLGEHVGYSASKRPTKHPAGNGYSPTFTPCGCSTTTENQSRTPKRICPPRKYCDGCTPSRSLLGATGMAESSTLVTWRAC